MKIEIEGKDFLDRFVKKWVSEHPQAAICPECGEDCKTTALVGLIYTFESCNCSAESYAHLVEQLHHRSCYEETICHNFGLEIAKH